MTAIDESPQTVSADDWWDRLYAEAETVAAEPVPLPRASAGRVRGRLPQWWAEKPEDLTALNADVEDERAGEAGAGAVEVEGQGDAQVEDDDQEDEEGGKGRWFRPESGYYPCPSVPVPARPALSAGTKRLVYNVSAAAVGYFYGPTRMVGGWIESCGQQTSIGGALVLGGGICLLTAHFWDRRTRHWMPGLAWVARIPLASVITALALYAPASQI